MPISQDGATPVWIASQMGHAAVVKTLLENSAEVDSAREVRMMFVCVLPKKSLY